MGAELRTRLSIFMNVFNVHVNRVPAAGTVTGLAYHPGKFINASFDKASEDNERMAVRLKLADGPEIAVVQIAGLVARRIRSISGRVHRCAGVRVSVSSGSAAGSMSIYRPVPKWW